MIAAKVTQQLKITLLGKLTSTPVNIEAYNLYLQAKQVILQLTAEASKNAETLLRQSIAIDATYAPAWSMLSKIIYNQVHRYVTIPMTVETIASYMAAVKKAIALDPNYGDGYAGLAFAQSTNWDFKGANTNMNKALTLAPESALVINSAAGKAQNLGKLEESLQLYLKAIDLDPLYYSGYFNLSIT